MIRKTCLAILLGSLAWGGCARFTDPDEPGAKAALRGRAVLADGNPAAGLDVYLVQGSTTTKVGTTDAQGGFEVGSATSGKVTVVLNDRKGSGALQEVVLYTNGTNDLGDLQVDRLERWPEIVTLTGVGYEERVTRINEEYSHPFLNRAGTKAYAARKRLDQQLYSIVEIVLATGEERVLLSEVDFRTWNGRTLWDQFTLIGDRIVAVKGRFFDSTTGAEVKILGHDWFSPDYAWLSGNEFFFLRAPSHWQHLEAYQGTTFMYLVRLDLDSGVAYESWPFYQSGPGKDPGSLWLEDYPFSIFSFDRDRLVFTALGVCGSGYQLNPDCSSGGPGRTKEVRVLDLRATDQGFMDEKAAILNPWDIQTPRRYRPMNEFAVVVGNGLLLIMFDDYYRNFIGRLDLGTGEVTPLNLDPSVYFMKMWLTGDPKKVGLLFHRGVADGLTQPVYQPGIGVLDVESLEFVELETKVALDGTSYQLCTSEYDCDLTAVGQGGLRIDFTPGGQEGLWLSADFDAQNRMVRARKLYVGDQSWPQHVFKSPAGGKEAAIARDKATGFAQVFLGADQGHDPLTQVTFLPAEHQGLAFDPTGTYLYTFTRDPISGYVQLFRIAVKPE